MGREARLSSGTGIYHVMFRGINHEHIFESPADYQKMKKIIQEVKAEMPFKVYAYCLMVNHVHLLLREEHAADLSRIMKKILVRYVMYFNKAMSQQTVDK